LQWEADYTIGSGGRGHSYFTDRDGYLFQTPVSWYAQQKKWDLSPGFGPHVLTGRAVSPECLYCHANRVRFVAGSVNRYAKPVFDGHAIGCQRCHGPGELHVASRQRFEPVPAEGDSTIANPRRLERRLRDAVCEQCHLAGEARTLRHGRGLDDYRPGLPLEQFWAVFVPPPAAGGSRKAVSHVEQMYQSRCFQASDGPDGLGCISCHDPHAVVPVAQRVTYYRGRCLQCHERHGCSLPVAERRSRSAEDSCVECHMPRFGASDIPHTASTDHRILRDGKTERTAQLSPPPDKGFPIVSFYGGRGTTDAAEDGRDLAVTLARLAVPGQQSVLAVLERTLPLFDVALRRDPDDLPAAEARGYVLGMRERYTESLAAFEAILARAPAREAALVGAASSAEALGRREAAVRYWRRAVAANPWAPGYRESLVHLLIEQEAWDEARSQCDAWVRLDPFQAEARAARVTCLLAVGDKEEARAEFARLEALAPPNLRDLQLRFGRKPR
jgi:tetratricopeptide (TPR) repeat protein